MPATEPAAPAEPPPPAGTEVFGVQLPLAERFAALLGTEGVLRGVIGPREPQRIWSRHLLNCGVVSELFPHGARVVDVGSGAGLPGIVLAIRRRDLRVDLIEPLQRRVDFLGLAVTELGLADRVRVLRGRAEDPTIVATSGGADWVTARAVAPIDRLVRWCLPLLGPGGRLALVKGASAADELVRHRNALAALGIGNGQIVRCGIGQIDPPTVVVVVDRPRRDRQQRKGRP